jgi:hypothetical protein
MHIPVLQPYYSPLGFSTCATNTASSSVDLENVIVESTVSHANQENADRI